jgi:hypothetical protein
MVLLCALLSALLFFRAQVFSGMEIMPGDIWDGRLIMGFVEHWRLVFSGQQDWNTLSMFWPRQGSLGYSDTFFIVGLINALYCRIGLGQYFAYTSAFITLAFAGFLLMYLFLRRAMSMPKASACVLSALFVNLSPLQMAGTHVQLLMVWLCPGVLFLGWKAMQGGRRATAWAAACGLSLALLFFTTFYVPWFLTLFVCICAALYLLFRLVRLGLVCEWWNRLELRAAYDVAAAFVRAHARVFAVFGGCFLVCLAPFLIIYLPVLETNGSWSFEGAALSLPSLVDYVNVGSDNYFWGWFFAPMHLFWRYNGCELEFGLPPLTMIVFFCALILMLVSRIRARRTDALSLCGVVAGLAVLLCWLLMFKFHAWAGWKLVHAFVPGASAIRAIFRFNVLLSMMVLLVIAAWLRGLASSRGRLGGAVSLLLPALLLGEQLARMPVSYAMRRSEEVARIEAIPPPPADAKVFYLKSSNPGAVWTHMVAFRIAQELGLETINGYSGIWPVDWPLEHPEASDYERNVYRWLKGEIPEGLYMLDLDAMQWHRRDVGWVPAYYKPGEDIVAARTLPFYAFEGWSGLEDWGVWSKSRQARIMMPLETALEPGARLEMSVHAFVTDKWLSQILRISVNGVELTDMVLRFGADSRDLSFVLPPECAGARRLDFVLYLPDANSPALVGDSADTRLLGLGLHSFRVANAEQ